MPTAHPGLDGVPVHPGDTVIAADPDDDEMAVCGPLVRQRGRWFVASGSGRLVPIRTSECRRV